MDLYKIKYIKYIEDISEEENKFLNKNFYESETDTYFATIKDIEIIESNLNKIERLESERLLKILRRMIEDGGKSYCSFELW